MSAWGSFKLKRSTTLLNDKAVKRLLEESSKLLNAKLEVLAIDWIETMRVITTLKEVGR